MTLQEYNLSPLFECRSQPNLGYYSLMGFGRDAREPVVMKFTIDLVYKINRVRV